MTSPLSSFLRHGQTRFYVGAAVSLGWLALCGWMIAPDALWIAVPVFVCFAYAVFRFGFEVLFNRTRIPTVTTPWVARRKIAALLKQEAARRGDTPFTIIDLGAGRGILTRAIAKAIPSARVIGIDLAHLPLAQAKWIQKWFGPANLSYVKQDFWTVDCRRVDAVILYLAPKTLLRMGEKLIQELPDGAMVLSFSFPLGDAWPTPEVLPLRTPFKETLYVYRKGGAR